MAEKLNPKDKVLLMRDEGEGNKLKVVKGIDKKGKIDAVDPMKAKQTDFIKIDKHADPIENFFKNFFNQAKNPSHTGFYAITVDMLDKVLSLSDKELEKFRIDPRDYFNKEQEQSTKETKQESTKEQVTEEKQEKMETKTQKNEQQTEFKQFDTSRIPESEYQKYGITPADIEGELKAMSYGYKSPHLLDIKPTIDGVEYPAKARLSLEEQADGSVKIVSHPYQAQVDLEKPIHNTMLPDDVKENLLATGNGGRVVELEPRPGEKVPSLVSIDKLTNRVEAVAVKDIHVSPTLKESNLSPEQQDKLGKGEKVLIEGMTSRRTKGTDQPYKFDAYVQFNAAKGGYDFTYDGLDRNRYRKQENNQEQQQEENKEKKVRIPDKLLGVPLNDKQKNGLANKEAVYVQGMMKDGQDQPFNAYVKVNTVKGKFDFFKWNPDKAKRQGAEVKPASESRTQVAVNTHGKTNEATKNNKEPLKQGQQRPMENQQQQNNPKIVKKSAGQKM